MIKDMWNNKVTDEVVEKEDKLTCYSKLLGKESKYNYKYTKGMTICLVPYSRLFKYNFYSDSFNSKKFSIV